jgi:hypothetical protein
MFVNAIFCLVQRGIVITFGINIVKYFWPMVVYTAGNMKKWLAKSQRKNVAEIHNSAICQTGH